MRGEPVADVGMPDRLLTVSRSRGQVNGVHPELVLRPEAERSPHGVMWCLSDMKGSHRIVNHP